MTSFEERREQILSKIPSNYNPYLHAIIPSTFGLSVIVISLFFLSVPTFSLLSIPIVLFLLFGFEWWVHKNVLHRKRPGVGFIYKLHEQAHHLIFTHEQMAMRDKKELWLVLMPPYAIVLAFLMLAPIIAGIALFSTNVAIITLITTMVFFLSYEWLHFCYHQPKDSFIGRNRLINYLRSTHTKHHNFLYMKKYNFNVTVPVFDRIMGTYKRDQ